MTADASTLYADTGLAKDTITSAEYLLRDGSDGMRASQLHALTTLIHLAKTQNKLLEKYYAKNKAQYKILKKFNLLTNNEN